MVQVELPDPDGRPQADGDSGEPGADQAAALDAQAVGTRDYTRRFTHRAAWYDRYRPDYPAAFFEFLQSELRLKSPDAVADIGAGTGISSEAFLRNGNIVYAVEPNEDMRAAGAARLGEWPGYRSINGTAEATGLDAASVALVLSATAFHWFDPVASRREFERILQPGGWVVMVWNCRLSESSALMADYQNLLDRHCGQEGEVGRRWRQGQSDLDRFFAPDGYRQTMFPNSQKLDFEGLRGRLLSSSYAPLPGAPAHDALLAGLAELFAKHEQDGTVELQYETRMYWGGLGR